MMTTGASDKKDWMKIIVAMCVAAVTLTASRNTLARDVVVGGGMSLGYEFNDRQYEDDQEVDDDDAEDQGDQQSGVGTDIDRNNKDERYSRLRLSPLITLTSSDVRDEVELRYSPSLWYDFEISDEDVDHDLLGSFSRDITRDWRAMISDRYRLSDEIGNRYGHSRTRVDASDDTTATDTTATDTTADTTTDGTARLSDTENRRRYWTNDLSLVSEYKYRQDSKFMIGYGYGILQNIDSDDSLGYEDYDRHEVLSEVGHRFNPEWKASVSGSYVRGLFDQVDSSEPLLEDEDENVTDINDDLDEYRAVTILQADFIEHHSQMLEYSFYAVDFDAAENEDATIQDVNLGWRWNFAKDGMFSVGAGPTYIKTEDADGEWGYNGRMALLYAFERGHIDISAKRGYEVLNFTGTNDNGLRKYWETLLKVDYRLLENVTAAFYTGYRYEDEDVVTEIEADPGAATDESVVVTERETFNRKRFSTGLSCGYSFWQWYTLSFAYDYSKQDSEVLDDSFDEHRVALTLSYETDFFKW